MARASFASGHVPVTDYTLYFTWHGFGTGATGLHLYSDNSFTTDDGAQGYWKYHQPQKTIDIQFTTGCLPLYEGRVKGGTAAFKGEMACTDGSGGYGTWTAEGAQGPVGSQGPGSSGPA